MEDASTATEPEFVHEFVHDIHSKNAEKHNTARPFDDIMEKKDADAGRAAEKAEKWGGGGEKEEDSGRHTHDREQAS
jgi:hypothetical protein